ncbi:MAG: hypothetical protein RDU25_01370 [Patescibacteria group bacterium]|nr:hypothetical protein [Patescibacteria group bacterium]
MRKDHDDSGLEALRAHAARFHEGDKQCLGRLFALQEELTGKTGQCVLLVDHTMTGPSRRPRRRGPLTNECVTFDRVEERKETRLSIGVLTSEVLRLGTTISTGLHTDRIAVGQPPKGKIAVLDSPLTFDRDQYQILFGSGNGRREFDSFGRREIRLVEVVAGNTEILKWFDGTFSDIIPFHQRHDWLTHLFGLMHAIGCEKNAGPELAHRQDSQWKMVLASLSGFDDTLKEADTPNQKIRDVMKKLMREQLREAFLLGHAEDPVVLDILRRYPDLV